MYHGGRQSHHNKHHEAGEQGFCPSLRRSTSDGIGVERNSEAGIIDVFRKKPVAEVPRPLETPLPQGSPEKGIADPLVIREKTFGPESFVEPTCRG